MKRPIRASLTFQDLSSDTKYDQSQSRETLPLKTRLLTSQYPLLKQRRRRQWRPDSLVFLQHTHNTGWKMLEYDSESGFGLI